MEAVNKESVCLQVKELAEDKGIKKFGIAFKNKDAGFYYAKDNNYFEVGKTLKYRIVQVDDKPNANRIYVPIEETVKNDVKTSQYGVKSSRKGNVSNDPYKRSEQIRAIGFCLSYAKDKIDTPERVTEYADTLLTWYNKKIDEAYGSTD